MNKLQEIKAALNRSNPKGFEQALTAEVSFAGGRPIGDLDKEELQIALVATLLQLGEADMRVEKAFRRGKLEATVRETYGERKLND